MQIAGWTLRQWRWALVNFDFDRGVPHFGVNFFTAWTCAFGFWINDVSLCFWHPYLYRDYRNGRWSIGGSRACHLMWNRFRHPSWFLADIRRWVRNRRDRKLGW